MKDFYVVQFAVDSEEWIDANQDDFGFDPQNSRSEQAAWRAARAMQDFLDFQDDMPPSRIIRRSVTEMEMT